MMGTVVSMVEYSVGMQESMSRLESSGELQVYVLAVTPVDEYLKWQIQTDFYIVRNTYRWNSDLRSWVHAVMDPAVYTLHA